MSDPLGAPSALAEFACPLTYCKMAGVWNRAVKRTNREDELDSATIYLFGLSSTYISTCLKDSSTCKDFGLEYPSLKQMATEAGIFDELLEWSSHYQPNTVNTPDLHYNWFFNDLQRDCSYTKQLRQPTTQASGAAYVNVGQSHRDANFGRVHWMSPVRLTYIPQRKLGHDAQDRATPAGGFTCPCIRPNNDKIMGSFGNGETCVCGDFADQPADVEFALTVENTWHYVLYNVVLCYLYMEPEHMCFPAIPWELPVISEFDWDIRQTLLEKGVNFTCTSQLGGDIEYDALGAPKCRDEDLQVHLQCAEYEPLVFDDSAVVPLVYSKYLPDFYVRQALLNRVWNTIAALHFTFRYLIMAVGGEFAHGMGAAWRDISRFLMGGFASFYSETTVDFFLTRLWVYPTCSYAVDIAAHVCRDAERITSDSQKQCPACCHALTPKSAMRQSDGDIYQREEMDCSKCHARDFSSPVDGEEGGVIGGQYVQHSVFFLKFYDYQRVLVVDEECVMPGETTPSSQMSLCFWIQAGSVMWVSLVVMVGYGFVRAFKTPLAKLWALVQTGMSVFFFSIFQIPIPAVVSEPVVVHATTVKEAMMRMGYTGQVSAAQVVRPFKRRITRVATSVGTAIANTREGVDRAFRRAVGAETHTETDQRPYEV